MRSDDAPLAFQPTLGGIGNLPEPREALIGDFTGDRKNDLLIMVHDRLLLYPQE